MEIVKVKSENGIRTVEITTDKKKETAKPKFDWAKNEKEIREKIKKKNEEIREIMMDYLITEKTEYERDLEYIKKKEGAYEKYIRANWPEVLQPTARTVTYEKWQTVVFIEDGWNVRLIKNIKVGKNEYGDRYGKIKGVIFSIESPDEVNDEIKMGINKGTKDELYQAVMKHNALVCDINKMVRW